MTTARMTVRRQRHGRYRPPGAGRQAAPVLSIDRCLSLSVGLVRFVRISSVMSGNDAGTGGESGTKVTNPKRISTMMVSASLGAATERWDSVHNTAHREEQPPRWM